MRGPPHPLLSSRSDGTSAIYFPLPISGNHICYLHPSSAVFSLAFISPTIFHHIILVLTLVKAYSHLKAEQLVGGSVMRVLRRDQIIYVLVRARCCAPES